MAGDMKRAVIFDLDGTLSNTIASIKYCADRALSAVGCGPFTEQQYKSFVGDGAATLIRRALTAGGDEEQVHFEKAFALYREILKEHCMYQVHPYDGIPELLAGLKERGLKLAVLSNKPHGESISVVETLFGESCFDIIQGQQEGIAIKPSPEGVFRIMGQLKMTAEDILYLGDTGTDMKTGKSAGAFTVGALWGFRDRTELEEGGADAVVEHPLQVLELL